MCSLEFIQRFFPAIIVGHIVSSDAENARFVSPNHQRFCVSFNYSKITTAQPNNRKKTSIQTKNGDRTNEREEKNIECELPSRVNADQMDEFIFCWLLGAVASVSYSFKFNPLLALQPNSHSHAAIMKSKFTKWIYWADKFSAMHTKARIGVYPVQLSVKYIESIHNISHPI